MAEVKNAFIKSKMNQDLDDRLIPPGEYREGINIQVSKSEGSDVGALENVLGNEIALTRNQGGGSQGVPVDFSVLAGLSTGTLNTVGMLADQNNSSIFVFLTSNKEVEYSKDSKNFIFEYNTLSEDVNLLAQGAFLNFSTRNRIYGINLLENLLFFTDNRNQPRKINIKLGIGGAFYSNEDQISIAKINPFRTIELYYQDIAAETPYSTPAVPVVNPNVNKFVSSSQDVTSKFLPNTTTRNMYYDPSWPGDPDYLEDKFVSFSYRFKFIDGEYSILAPFTQEAFIPKQDGYFIQSDPGTGLSANSIDENNAYQSTIVQFMENKVNNVGINIPLPFKENGIICTAKELNTLFHVQEIDILFKESDALAVKVLESIPFNGVNGFAPIDGLASQATTVKYDYQSRKPYKTLPESEIIRVYDKVPVKALGQEIISNRVVYSNFQDKHTPPSTMDYDVAVSNKSNFNGPETGSTVNPSTWSTSITEYPNHTLKQNRTYQVGFVLSDRFGRQSTTILSEVTNKVSTAVINNEQIEFGGSTYYHNYSPDPATLIPVGVNDINSWPGDSLKVKLNKEIPPELAVFGWPGLYNGDVSSDKYNPLGWYSYKIVVKQTEQEYYNVYLPGIIGGYPDTLIPATGGANTSFITLLSDNINKIPRDLTEVGPDQTQYRSSTVLYGRVTPEANINPVFNKPYYPTIDDIPYDSVVSTISLQNDLFNNTLNGQGAKSYGTIYQTITNPSLARLSVSGTAIGSLVPAGEETVQNIILGVYETAPVTSLLDIFWETSTTGLISDLNKTIEGAAQVSGLVDFDFIQSEGTTINGLCTKLPFSPSVEGIVGGVAIPNSEVTLVSVTRGSSTVNLVEGSTPEWECIPSGQIQPKSFNLIVKKIQLFSSTQSENEYIFTFQVKNQDTGLINQVVVRNQLLINESPVIQNAQDPDGVITKVVTIGDTAVDTITAVNGCVDASQDTSNLVYSINPSDVLQISQGGVITQNSGSAIGRITATVTVKDASGGNTSLFDTVVYNAIFGEIPINVGFGKASDKLILTGMGSVGMYWSNSSNAINSGANLLPQAVQNNGGSENSINRYPNSALQPESISNDYFNQISRTQTDPSSEVSGNFYSWTAANLNSSSSVFNLPSNPASTGLTAGTAFIQLSCLHPARFSSGVFGELSESRRNTAVDTRAEYIGSMTTRTNPNQQRAIGLISLGWPCYLQYREEGASVDDWKTALDVENAEIKFGGSVAWNEKFPSNGIRDGAVTADDFDRYGVLSNEDIVECKTPVLNQRTNSQNPDHPIVSGGINSAINTTTFVFGEDQSYGNSSSFGDYRLVVGYPRGSYAQNTRTQGPWLSSIKKPYENPNTDVWAFRNPPNGTSGAQAMSVRLSFGDFYYPPFPQANGKGSFAYRVSAKVSVTNPEPEPNKPVYAREWSFKYVTQFYNEASLETLYVGEGAGSYIYSSQGEGINSIWGSGNSSVSFDNTIVDLNTPGSNESRKWIAQFDVLMKKVPKTATPIVTQRVR